MEESGGIEGIEGRNK
jgi:hypothetical protein